MIWQRVYGDSWRFGKEVRGVVRKPYYAEVYYNENADRGWAWFVGVPDLPNYPRGWASSFDDAVREAEAALEAFGVELD